MIKTVGCSSRAFGLAAILALAAASCLAATPDGPGKALTKTFKIYNNSLLGPIYPVMSTPKQGIDKWLQAVFKVPKGGLETQLYANDNVYRIYINPTTGGIPPGGMVVLKVPLYTQLKPTSEGVVPDEFINWWNGGRTSIYDVPKAIERDYKEDTENPTTPIAGTPLVTCVKGCLEPLAIYQSAKGKGDLPANDPAQLTEYTLGGIDEKQSPIGFLPEKVDYDISYVDQVYLPIAMEALNNFFIGWIGTTQDVGAFRSGMQTFLDSATYPGWPTYIDSEGKPFLRIPSTGTIYASESGANPSPDLTAPGESFNATTRYWKNCTDGGSEKECVWVRNVEALWLANYASYRAAWTDAKCNGVLPEKPDVDKVLLPHVYGWAAFNETPPPAKCEKAIENAIYDTPGYGKTYQKIAQEYKNLQYETPGGVFNPYVQLVHFKPYLDMTNAYSFSIDDAVGNMDTIGDGLIIAIGGVRGLPNSDKFDETRNVQVTVGAKAPNAPDWNEYGFCTQVSQKERCLPSTPYNANVLSFNLQTVTYPTAVTLLDTAGRQYKFVVEKGPPYPPSPGTHSVITCLNLQDEWCQYINAYTDDKSNPKLPVNAVVARGPLPAQ